MVLIAKQASRASISPTSVMVSIFEIEILRQKGLHRNQFTDQTLFIGLFKSLRRRFHKFCANANAVHFNLSSHFNWAQLRQSVEHWNFKVPP